MEKYGVFSDILPLVRRPSRYIDQEVNSFKKDLSEVSLRFCLAFPDVYEVGISHLGIQILYSILNSHPDIACERVFAPWVDLEALLRERRLPLSSLESGTRLKDFDCIGFSLQYELSYTNILTMLDLSNIPLLARDRDEGYPLIIGGGPMAYNPEPLTDFFDAFCIGDGEDLILELCLKLIDAKKRGLKKKEILEELSEIEGVYVASLFEIEYGVEGRIDAIRCLKEGCSVKRRLVADLENAFVPTDPIVPYTQAIHDRLTVEISRGCTRGCRFCHAGMVYRPVRERSVERIISIIEESIRNTGYDEVSLLSLSTGDYTCIEPLLKRLMESLKRKRIAISLPSLRVGSISPLFVEEISRVRKTGFTIAPEAGTERLRAVINKDIDEDALIETAGLLFGAGWRSIKLYFMIGLPTEGMDDIDGIVELSKRVQRAAKGRRVTVKVSVSTFVPKPQTPFQWLPMARMEEIVEKQSYLRNRLRRGFEVKTHDPCMSLLEGVFARGDRRLGAVIKRAYELGCRFDGWSEHFRFDNWIQAFKDSNIDMDFYIYRERGYGETLPWDHISGFIDRDFLYREYNRAINGELSEDCRKGRCEGCGVCDFKEIRNVIYDSEASMEGKESLKFRGDRGVRDVRSRSSKIRINFSKTGVMRFLSHLELINLFYRALRRADFPLVYSKGFHPLPRVSFSKPLPVGMESLDEYMDVEVEGVPVLNDLIDRLKKEMPDGLDILGMEFIHPDSPSIISSIKGATYLIQIDGDMLCAGGVGVPLKKRIEDVLTGDRAALFHGLQVSYESDYRAPDLIDGIDLCDEGITITLKEGEKGQPRIKEIAGAILEPVVEDKELIRLRKLRTFIS